EMLVHLGVDALHLGDAVHVVEGIAKANVRCVDFVERRDVVAGERLEPVDHARDARVGRYPVHKPVIRWMSAKYARYGRWRSSLSVPVKRRGKWISKRPLCKPRRISLAASSAVISAGILKSFLSVRGVLTKPGL